jgi:CRP-like cAMP-binding protein
MAGPVKGADEAVGLLLKKMRHRDAVSEHEAAILRDIIEEVEERPAGSTLVSAGEHLRRSILLVSGIVSRYKDLADGQRQITELHVPGDFVDLHGYLLKRLEHHVGTLTPVRLAYVPHQRLTEITETEPHLARMLWLSTLIDSAIQRERILSVGRRSAVARIAHLMCELLARLELVDGQSNGSFPLPITQLDLGDANGLTSVHVNRMLRQLRDEGLMTFRGGVVEVHDRARLERLAEFDRSYLFLECEPR